MSWWGCVDFTVVRNAVRNPGSVHVKLDGSVLWRAVTVRVVGTEFLQQILALSFQIHDVIIREDQEAPPEQRLIGVNEGG